MQSFEEAAFQALDSPSKFRDLKKPSYVDWVALKKSSGRRLTTLSASDLQSKVLLFLFFAFCQGKHFLIVLAGAFGIYCCVSSLRSE
jgi:hypothetical protein